MASETTSRDSRGLKEGKCHTSITNLRILLVFPWITSHLTTHPKAPLQCIETFTEGLSYLLGAISTGEGDDAQMLKEMPESFLLFRGYLAAVDLEPQLIKLWYD